VQAFWDKPNILVSIGSAKKKAPKACAIFITTASIYKMMIIYPENINQILEISLDCNQFFIGQSFGNAVTVQDLVMKVMAFIR